MTEAPLTERPDHVPAELAFDFDMFAPPGLEEDPHLAWKRVQDEYPDIFWTPRNGGHWVMTRAEDIGHVQKTYQEFSSREPFLPRNVVAWTIPVQYDPPEHTPYRRLLMPAFLPKAVKKIEDKAREVAIELIERLAPRGHCEFVGEFAGVMPIIAFLTLMGLPAQDATILRDTVVPANSPKSKDAWAFRENYVREAIAQRRQEPREDLMSDIIHGEIDGRPLTEEEVFRICLLLLGGGLDTVASMTSFIARFLASSPEHRRQLIEEPKLMPKAIEELARRFGTSNLARIVAKDMDYKGVFLRRDDMVLIPFPLYGLDERMNRDPLKVDFTRTARHAAFGSGAHTCIGAVLARAEIRIFLEEWLKRIPDFRIQRGTHPVNVTGIVNNAIELHLEWDPQPAIAA